MQFEPLRTLMFVLTSTLMMLLEMRNILFDKHMLLHRNNLFWYLRLPVYRDDNTEKKRKIRKFEKPTKIIAQFVGGMGGLGPLCLAVLVLVSLYYRPHG